MCLSSAYEYHIKRLHSMVSTGHNNVYTSHAGNSLYNSVCVCVCLLSTTTLTIDNGMCGYQSHVSICHVGIFQYQETGHARQSG